MSKYAFFLGCIMPNRYPEIEVITRKVLDHLGIELVDMHGASCCPAPGVIGSFDLETWLTVAARNISIAEEMNLDILTCCNGCYATLQETNEILKRRPEIKRLVNEKLKEIGREYKGNINIYHVMEILEEKKDIIQKKTKVPLSFLKVASHYGCHYLKPSEMRRHENPEMPKNLDEIVELVGATSIEYKDKNMCCGAGGGVRAGNKTLSLEYTKNKLKNMRGAGAQAIVTPCIFCYMQFERGQREIREMYGEDYDILPLFITQFVGLALGYNEEDVGIKKR